MATECDVVLLAKTFEIDTSFSTSHTEWTRLIDSNNYDKAKSELNLLVPGYFDGEYNDFEEKRASHKSEEWYLKRETVVTANLRSFVPKEAIDAWVQCVMQKPGSGFIPVTYSNADASGADVTITWEPPLGTLGPLFDCGISISGGKVDGPDTFVHRSSKPQGFTGKAILRVKRDSPTTFISVRAYGVIKGGFQYVGNCPIEPPPPPPAKQSRSIPCGNATDTCTAEIVADHDMTVDINFTYVSSYEQSGDPYRQMSAVIDGVEISNQKVQSYGKDDRLFANAVRRLSKGQKMNLYMKVSNFRTRTEGLYISWQEV